MTRFDEKPVIIFAQDNSQSIPVGIDSIFYKTEYINSVNQLLTGLNKDFVLEKYTFGKTVSGDFNLTFSEPQTDISDLFEEINSRFSHRNVGALILASDGIFNRGFNPLYSAQNLRFPVYTIALGDTNIRKDIILSKVNYNRIAYQGNEFPVEVIINGKKCRGLTTEFSLIKSGKELITKTISFNSQNDFQTVNLNVEATETGLQRFSLKLSPIEDEISQENNKIDFFVDVLKGKQRILILANSPHPDISALKQTIQQSRNYEVDDYIITGFSEKPGDYDLVILHGLPSPLHNISAVINEIEESEIPVLFIITRQTALNRMNDLKSGITIATDKIIYNESVPAFNDDFVLFTLSDRTIPSINQFPPLVSPYGSVSILPAAQSLFFQKIGTVTTEIPLMLFNQGLEKKNGVILGEGLWKWRMNDYLRNENTDSFDELVNKTIQYLSTRVDKSFFRVYGKDNYDENEDIEFDAEVYNDSYELITDPDVALTITDSKGKNYPYNFSKTQTKYYLNAGSLPPDNYNFSARTQTGDKLLTDQGEFTVSPLNLEKVNTIADHNLLFNLADKMGGEMINPNEMDKLLDLIKTRDDIKTIFYFQKKYSELLNYTLLLVFIIILLAAEWFLRKRFGSY
jgi:hypothetical protein